jgi:hypothetical protein
MNMKNEIMGSFAGNAASELNDKQDNHSSLRPVIALVLALWLGLIFALGARGAFVGTPGTPPLQIFLGFAVPLAVFFAGYFGSSAFRSFVLGQDLRLLAGIQAWRWGGFGFLALYAHGILPALFAFPAVLGDMAIGITAPWILLGLVRNPAFAASRRYVMWNILGIVDLVVAVSLGAICSGFIPGLTGNVTTGAMAQLPSVLIPAYLVPIFIMLHVAALAQSRQLARSGKYAHS